MGKASDMTGKIAAAIKDMVEREIKLLAQRIDSTKKKDADGDA